MTHLFDIKAKKAWKDEKYTSQKSVYKTHAFDLKLFKIVQKPRALYNLHKDVEATHVMYIA